MTRDTLEQLIKQARTENKYLYTNKWGEDSYVSPDDIETLLTIDASDILSINWELKEKP